MTDRAAMRAHWNQRASLGATAGTQDLILKQLEQRALLDALRELPQPTMGLEIGCGLGETARLLVQRFPRLDLLAVDSAEQMIQHAVKAAAHSTRLRFLRRDVAKLPDGRFDVIYTQRMLINAHRDGDEAPTWGAQLEALQAIARRLRPDGRYLMVESSQDGLDRLQGARASLGLSAIPAPAHAPRYLREADLASVTCLRLIRMVPFSATYYFLSRIVNAYLAQQDGREPAYDATVNQLALKLTGAEVDPGFAQTRLWIWGKA